MNARQLLFWFVFLLTPSFTFASGKLAIIIDDVGYNAQLGRRATDLPGAFTLAILPFTPHTKELADRATRNQKEVMLHLPMSNTRHLPLGTGGLVSGMNHSDFLNTLRADLAAIPQLSGLNNHMGSQLTQEEEPMKWLMAELIQRNLYFVDSRTTADTKALTIAQQIGVASGKRDIFLDNSRDPATIKQQLLKAIILAKSQKITIAIGHPYPETLGVLERAQSMFSKHGVELVPVSWLLTVGQSGLILMCYAPPKSLWYQPAANLIELPLSISDLF